MQSPLTHPSPVAAVTASAASAAAPEAVQRRRRRLFAGTLAVWGPGIIVMLADGDAGCLITAAQSGAQWGYRLILPQLLLIPVLYLVQEMTAPFLGHLQAKVLVGAAILGGALVSALVVSVAGSWGLAEVFGWKHSLNSRPGRDSAKFYLTYAAAHIAGAVLVLFSIDLVGLAVDVEVLNALMLPVVPASCSRWRRRRWRAGTRTRASASW